jgi:hypothetical protein
MSEAQKCGAIPIATNYSGLIEESCFPEFLINGYVAVRGQFNCYRAIVDARALAELMAKAVAYPSQDDYLESYSQFCRRVDLRFANRSWKSVGKTLYETAQSIHNGAVLIDNELTEI